MEATTEQSIRLTLKYDDLRIIEDALYYYRICTDQGGPDDYPVEEIRMVERKVARYIIRAEDAAGV